MNEILKKLMAANAIESLDKPNELEDAVIELADMVAAQEEALCELAEMIGGEV